MVSFLLGTLTSITATVVLVVLARMFSPFSGRISSYLNLLLSLPRLQRTGLNNFISSRSDYRLLKGGETIQRYLSNVHHSLVYIGFWHAKGIEMDNIKEVFRDLLEKGRTIELILLREDISNEKAEIIAKYLGISTSSLRSRVSEAWKYVREMATEFANLRGTFIVKGHSDAVYASCFIVDADTPTAKLLVDIKIFGMGRENGFAIELVKTADCNSLYDRFLTSFTKLQREAEAANIPP